MVKYMNVRSIFISFLTLICLFILPTLLLASDETLTITTYYPSPYGVYNEMRSKRIAIGDNYINNADYTWELTDGDGGEVDYLADLVVEGNVGIGTVTPAEKMEVSGNIKLSGASATYKITNVANPTANQDVATKAYVDAAGGVAYIVTTQFDATQLQQGNCSCTAYPAANCPSGWTIVTSWTYCVCVTATSSSSFDKMPYRQTLCSK